MCRFSWKLGLLGTRHIAGTLSTSLTENLGTLPRVILEIRVLSDPVVEATYISGVYDREFTCYFSCKIRVLFGSSDQSNISGVYGR